MTFGSNAGTLTNFGMTVDGDAEIRFVVGESYSDEITLVIGDSVAEISFSPEKVEVLRDKADDAVRTARELRRSVDRP